MNAAPEDPLGSPSGGQGPSRTDVEVPSASAELRIELDPTHIEGSLVSSWPWRAARLSAGRYAASGQAHWMITQAFLLHGRHRLMARAAMRQQSWRDAARYGRGLVPSLPSRPLRAGTRPGHSTWQAAWFRQVLRGPVCRDLHGPGALSRGAGHAMVPSCSFRTSISCRGRIARLLFVS